MIVTFNKKKLETEFQTTTQFFLKKRFLETVAKNQFQFLRNCNASKHALNFSQHEGKQNRNRIT
jgi:hypothetical protein